MDPVHCELFALFGIFDVLPVRCSSLTNNINCSVLGLFYYSSCSSFFFQMIYMSRISIFKKTGWKSISRGFLGWEITWCQQFFNLTIFDPNRPPGQNRWSKAYFGIVPVLVQKHVLPILNLSVTPFRLKIFSNLCFPFFTKLLGMRVPVIRKNSWKEQLEKNE